MRSALSAFLFSGEEVFKTLPMLSGGEKVRLALAKIFQHRPNLLILDEPTNHMDIVGKETLEKMLDAFEGTLIFVSHDRYFVRKIATSLLIFEEEGVKYYPNSYEEYIVNTKEEGTTQEIVRDTRKLGASKPQRSSQKIAVNPGKEQAKKERKKEKLIAQIEAIETYIVALKEQMESSQIAHDYEKLCEINSKIELEEQNLISAMEEWEILEKN